MTASIWVSCLARFLALPCAFSRTSRLTKAFCLFLVQEKAKRSDRRRCRSVCACRDEWRRHRVRWQDGFCRCQFRQPRSDCAPFPDSAPWPAAGCGHRPRVFRSSQRLSDHDGWGSGRPLTGSAGCAPADRLVRHPVTATKGPRARGFCCAALRLAVLAKRLPFRTIAGT